MDLKIFFSIILLVFATSQVFAHGGGAGKSTERKVVKPSQQSSDFEVSTEMRGKLIQQTMVDEYELKLKIVDVKDSVPDGGSHNLLVSIKRDGRTQKRLSVNSTIDDMQGNIKSKSMMDLGDWHLAGYDFVQSGQYIITVSFKTTDGVTRSSTINYP